MRWLQVGLVTAVALLAPAAWAEDAKPQDGVAGSDVMGDKGRSGPDGWSWAPVTRDQGAGAKAPGQAAADAHATPNTRPGLAAGKALAPGDDPGTPMATDARGPGALDAKGSPHQP